MESQNVDWKEIAITNKNLKAKKLLERKEHIARRSAFFKTQGIRIFKQIVGDFLISYSTEYNSNRDYYQNGILQGTIGGINITFAICSPNERHNKQIAMDLIYKRNLISDDRFNIFIEGVTKKFLTSIELHALIPILIGKKISDCNQFNFIKYNFHLYDLFNILTNGELGKITIQGKK